MSLKWRQQLSVGNDLIDSDHKHLIDIINRVEDSLRHMERSGLTDALEDLSRYSRTHFAAEEKIAAAAGYAHVARLHESHGALLERLDQLRQELGGGWTTESVERFTNMLRDWLINHVIKEDLRMKPSLAKYSPKFDPR